MELSLAKADGIDRMKLTPAVCAGALGFALPALAKATEADGELSLALDVARLPSTGLAQAEMLLKFAGAMPPEIELDALGLKICLNHLQLLAQAGATQ